MEVVALQERTRRLPWLRLGLLGTLAASECLYALAAFWAFPLLSNGSQLTDLTGLTGQQPAAGVVIVFGLAALFSLYGLAAWLLPRSGRAAAVVVLGGAALLSFTLVFLYPVTAMDVYNYAVEGHILSFDHLNPLTTPPASAVGDAFVLYAGSWSSSPSPYGPVWLTISRIIAHLAGSDVVLAVLIFKAMAAAAVWLTTALLFLAGQRHLSTTNAARGALLFGWNPLVQIELVGNGHNDAVMILLGVGGLLLFGWARRRLKERSAATAPAIGIATAALVASVLVKFLTAPALPLAMVSLATDRHVTRRRRCAALLICAVVAVATAVLAYAPFWSGSATFLRLRQADSNYLASIPALAILLVPASIGWLLYARALVLGTTAAVSLWYLMRGRCSLGVALFEITFVGILVVDHFAGWYVPLLLALAVLSRDSRRCWRAVALTLTATITTPLWAYYWPLNQATTDLKSFHLILVPLTFLPPLLIALRQAWVDRT
jgi:hypothetical protein